MWIGCLKTWWTAAEHRRRPRHHRLPSTAWVPTTKPAMPASQKPFLFAMRARVTALANADRPSCADLIWTSKREPCKFVFNYRGIVFWLIGKGIENWNGKRCRFIRFVPNLFVFRPYKNKIKCSGKIGEAFPYYEEKRQLLRQSQWGICLIIIPVNSMVDIEGEKKEKGGRRDLCL